MIVQSNYSDCDAGVYFESHYSDTGLKLDKVSFLPIES
jgi:hypothetical protein